MIRSSLNGATDSRKDAIDKELFFADILKQYNGMISRICFYYASSRNAYEDLRQDVLVNIWRGIGSFRNDARESTWIYRVCLNTCITGWRREKSRGHEMPVDLIRDIAADDEREHTDDIETLHHLISLLSPAEKALIMMQLDGMTYDEMAALTGYPRNTVATRLHRIREKMRRAANCDKL